MQGWLDYFLGLGFFGFYLPTGSGPARGPDPAAGLEALKQEAAACKACPLHKTATNLVFGVGNPAAEIVFVGEAPGEDEDLQGEPFVGRAGQLLTRIIRAMGLAREDVYIANILKHRPPNNRNPLPEEVRACTPWLDRQIDIIRPKVIITLGKFSTEYLSGNPEGITRVRGRWHEWRGIPLMPTFHPSYLLRNPSAKRQVWDDMKAVLERLGRPVPTGGAKG
jgi:uracil-DNA glycosylase